MCVCVSESLLWALGVEGDCVGLRKCVCLTKTFFFFFFFLDSLVRERERVWAR